MDEVLDKLFESRSKTRLLRLFMRNVATNFTFGEITKMTQVKSPAARNVLNKLLKIGVVKKRIVLVTTESKIIPKKSDSRKKPNSKVRVKKKKLPVYSANQSFWLFYELKDLVTKASVASKKKLLRKIKGLGNIKLAIISGIFINNNDKSRTDLLIVGDNIKKGRLENFLAETESELGRHVQYTIMDTEEFKYRINMYDRFLRDILEFPHEKLVNRINI